MYQKDFVINAGPNGTFRPSGQYQTFPEHIDDIFKRFEKDKVKNISIFFHGGLVNEKTGMDTANKMAKHITEIGHAPLCFVWETGLVETLKVSLSKIHERKIFNKLIKVLVKKLSEKLGFDLQDGRGMGVHLTDFEIDQELSKDEPFKTYSIDTLKSSNRGDVYLNEILDMDEESVIINLRREIEYMIESDREFVELIKQSEFTETDSKGTQSRGIISTAAFIKHVAYIVYRVIKRFVKKRDHNFYPTIIEEILRELYIADLGAWVWSSMKKKSNEMWNSNQDLVGLDRYAGRYLLDRLADYCVKFQNVNVNLIGHSAGSIAICHLLQISSVEYEFLKFNKIVFMAPACRVELFKSSVVDKPDEFKGFRMFTMSNQFEVQDRLVPFFYTHSLLYLISGILEDEGKSYDAHILGLERHILGEAPYHDDKHIKDVNDFIYNGSNNRVAFSQSNHSALEGLRTMSITHGGFDDDKETISSMKFYLKDE